MDPSHYHMQQNGKETLSSCLKGRQLIFSDMIIMEQVNFNKILTVTTKSVKPRSDCCFKVLGSLDSGHSKWRVHPKKSFHNEGITQDKRIYQCMRLVKISTRTNQNERNSY